VSPRRWSHRRSTAGAFFVTVVAGFTSLAACDPVQQSKIDALGGEAADVPRGPLHRAGQPCTVCHDGAVGDPVAFSVAGTVYRKPSSTVGMNSVTVTMTDATGSSYETTSNAAGNFYVEPSAWTPAYPIRKVQIHATSTEAVTMYSRIGWSGSCGSCHVPPEGPTSPGRIVFTLDDGGTPP
jgi:hypothetical protein